MNIYLENAEINVEDIGEFLDLLDKTDLDLYEHGIPEDATLFTLMKEFESNNVAIIKICSGTENLFVDATLVDEDGNEVCILDPEDDILGEFWFVDDNGDEHILNIILLEDVSV